MSIDTTPASPENRIAARLKFLENCHPETVRIHAPIVDLRTTKGFLNPAGLGHAEEFSRGLSTGQSTVAFDCRADFINADAKGESHYGGAEYGIVQTPEAAVLCQKLSDLHKGAGAIVTNSGISAIAAVFQTFLKGDKPAILLPDNSYWPAQRILNQLKDSLNAQLHIGFYSSRADGEEIKKLAADLQKEGRDLKLIYLEAPGSQTFEIPEINSIIAAAKERGIKTVMDNTWASHVRFKPIHHGVDIVVQATTKYEGGYADTPSGIVIAASPDDHKSLAYTSRVYGMGAVAPPTLRRLFNRISSTQERMDQHYESARQVTEWLRGQSFVQDILAPFLPTSPDFRRFEHYFKKGNGLFTVVFKDTASPRGIEKYLDGLHLFKQGESWGGHVSLVQPAHPKRQIDVPVKGEMVRFSMGLENPQDLIKDLNRPFTPA